MKTKVFVVVVALMCSGCGGCGVFDSALVSEYKELEAEQVTSSSAEAEALYKKTAEFVERVAKTEDAPEGLLPKARGLQQQRAKDFLLASAKDLNPVGVAKASAALIGVGLDPKAVALSLGIEVTLKKLEGDREFLKSDDIHLWK